MRIIWISILGFLCFLFIVIFSINYYILSFSKNNYYTDVTQVPDKYVGLVFGASVIGRDRPSLILQNRLDVAISAYKIGKVQKIIVSGDNSKPSYNEPLVMQKYLIQNGVDLDDIYLDYAGFDTYDSLYRAKEIFGVRDVILFTQGFHLKRASYISTKLGINSYLVETNLGDYKNKNYNLFRELFARVKAFLEVDIFKSKPTYLGDTIEIITDEKIEETKKNLLK